jgi:hypothetical protein
MYKKQPYWQRPGKNTDFAAYKAAAFVIPL